jgi:hypothetical protein
MSTDKTTKAKGSASPKLGGGVTKQRKKDVPRKVVLPTNISSLSSPLADIKDASNKIEYSDNPASPSPIMSRRIQNLNLRDSGELKLIIKQDDEGDIRPRALMFDMDDMDNVPAPVVVIKNEPHSSEEETTTTTRRRVVLDMDDLDMVDVTKKLEEWSETHPPLEEIATAVDQRKEYTEGVSNFLCLYTAAHEGTKNEADTRPEVVGSSSNSSSRSDSDSDVENNKKKNTKRASKARNILIKSIKRKGANPRVIAERFREVLPPTTTLPFAPTASNTINKATAEKTTEGTSEEYKNAIEEAADVAAYMGKIPPDKMDNILSARQAEDATKPLHMQSYYYAAKDEEKAVARAVIERFNKYPTNTDNTMGAFAGRLHFEPGQLQNFENKFGDMGLIQTFIRSYQPRQNIPVNRKDLLQRFKKDIPYRTRDAEQACLREYIPGKERPCTNGNDCEGMFIGPRPVILPEMLNIEAMINKAIMTPKEWKEYSEHMNREAKKVREFKSGIAGSKAATVKEEKTNKSIDDNNNNNGELPEMRFPCVMCGRVWVMYNWITARSEVSGIKGNWWMQWYYNLQGIRGEYAMEQCIMSSKDDYQGLPLPVVIHVRHWYEQTLDKDGRVVFLQSGYIKPKGTTVEKREELQKVFL